MVQVIVRPNNKKDVLHLLEESVERKKFSLKFAINQTKKELSRFEKRYKMKTNSFYKKFQQGLLGDKPDFIEWAGEKEILNRLKNQFNQIQEISFAH